MGRKLKNPEGATPCPQPRRSFNSKLGEEYMLFSKALPYFPEFQQMVGKSIRSKMGANKEFSILEIGCGPGTTTIDLLRLNRKARIIGVDISEVMLAQARGFLSGYIERGRLELIHADATEYLRSLPAESVDSIASAWVLHNFTQDARRELHSEIFRVLRKGGVFVNGDKYAEEDPLLHKEAYETVLGMMRDTFIKEGKYDLCKEWDEHMEEDEKPERIMFELASIAQLKGIGFREVEKVWRHLTDAVIIAIK